MNNPNLPLLVFHFLDTREQNIIIINYTFYCIIYILSS